MYKYYNNFFDSVGFVRERERAVRKKIIKNYK